MRYAVACLLKKLDKPKASSDDSWWGVTTMYAFYQQTHRLVTATSEDEARGKAVAIAMKGYAGYDLMQVSVLEIPELGTEDQ